MNKNKGRVMLTFFDDKEITVNIKSANLGATKNDEITESITVFTDNINNTTTYNMFDIKDLR